MQSKTCWRCETSKPVNLFYTNKAIPSTGLDAVCKECSRALARERYQKNKTAGRARVRTYYQDNRTKIAVRQKNTARRRGAKWYAANPEKYRARAYLNYYVRKGDIIKPVNCTQCHEIKPLEGHHEDYKKPLDVNWLCRKCHEYRHHG